MRHRNFWPWGIQTGPFATCQNWFCSIIFPLFCPASHNKLFLITPERGREEGTWAENWERDFLKSEWDTGFSDPGAFKLDHLQSVELIRVPKFFHLFALNYGRSNSLLPQREEGRKEGAGVENGKRGFLQKWMRHRGFCNWGTNTERFAAS